MVAPRLISPCPSRRRKRSGWKKALLVGAALLLSPVAAYATYPVIDSALVGIQEEMKALQQTEFVKQLNTMKDQLKELKDSVKFLDDIKGVMSEVKKLQDEILGGVGSIGNLTVPVPNLDKLSNQLKSESKCLFGAGDLPLGLNLEDMNFGSLCGARAGYKKVMFASKKELDDMPHDKKMAVYAAVKQRRQTMLAESGVEALAHADMILGKDKQGDTTQKAIEDLQQAADSAKDLQDREAVQAKAQITIAQLLLQNNRLLAAQLKLQTTFVFQTGIGLEEIEAMAQGSKP